MLPDNLPSIRNAKLPALYQRARDTLARCNKEDECSKWADKAAAMASYAKQADDKSLYDLAVRIRARAIRRCGELLRQIESATGAHRKKDAGVPLSRKGAASRAGLSERRRKTALRVANVPDEEFEEAVERDSPATIKELAKRGTKPRPLVDLNGRDPKDFQAATAALGRLRDFNDFISKADVKAIVRGASENEVGIMLDQASRFLKWFRDFVEALGRKP